MAAVDVLIPTCRRPAALAVTLTSLCAQQCRDFHLVISDQTEAGDPLEAGEVQAVLRVLRLHGHAPELNRHLPPRGMAEHRQFLLQRSAAPYVLFLDDDLILEPDVVGRMLEAMRRERCGFVGCAVIGLSYLDDKRPEEQGVDFWRGPVRPEIVDPASPAWNRYRLHNAANLYHRQCAEGLCALDGTPVPTRTYHVAWVGGCVMYDRSKLVAAGGFEFWQQLPAHHCGEDVLAQLRVMSRFGGCGLMPSGVYHQELPTTLEDRRANAPRLLPVTA